MKRDMRGVFTMALAVLVLVAMPGAVLADDDEKAGPTYTMIHHEEVGPANARAYEENSKAWVAAFKEAGASEEWAWRTYAGPNFNYAFLTDVPNYAYLDGDDARWAAMVELIGKDKIDALSADGGGATGHRHELTKDLPEYDYTPEGGVGEFGFVHLATHSVKPGMGEKYKALLAKVTAARNKVGGGLAVRVSQVAFGHGSYQFAHLAKDRESYYSAKSVGAMLREAYGLEGAKAIFDDWRECITDFETSDWNFEPELSYMPGMGGDEDMMDGEEMMDDEEEMSEGE